MSALLLRLSVRLYLTITVYLKFKYTTSITWLQLWPTDLAPDDPPCVAFVPRFHISLHRQQRRHGVNELQLRFHLLLGGSTEMSACNGPQLEPALI